MRMLAFFVLVLILCAGASAEEMARYRGDMFSFQYPATWKQGVSDKGDIVIEAPDGQNGILAFAVTYTGDAHTFAEQYLSLYGGTNFEPGEQYEAISSACMNEIRIPGKWRKGDLDAEMVIMTGESHQIGFLIVGADALALEDLLLSSVELLGNAGLSGDNVWQGDRFSIVCPHGYDVMDSGTAIVFVDPDDTGNLVAVRAINLDVDYFDELAPAIAGIYLPESANLEHAPEMTRIGGRNAAIIRGDTDAGPLAFYVIGSGKTALAVMLMGEKTIDMAEEIISSIIMP